MPAKREVVAAPIHPTDASLGVGAAASAIVRGGDFLFANLKQLLAAAGSSLDKVVKVNVLIHSMLEAPNMNEVYARFFPDPPPARTVCGARLPDGVKVIIECTALA